MAEKIIIVGGRSGTSVMARLLQSAGLMLWGDKGTEPNHLAETIYKNVHKPEVIKNALLVDQDWQVAKCPEFAFCLPTLNEVYPNARYIWMIRPISERIASHIKLNWHNVIHMRLMNNAALRKFVEETTDSKTTGNAAYNDGLYFTAQDICLVRLFTERKISWIDIKYSDLNDDFGSVMQSIADDLNLDYNANIGGWKTIKSLKQQAGRWEK